ncbi:NAD(P)-dependent oxidoreductase [Streptomyces monashensis]|uniref:NAD(P)-dependent oxidoreductase n=1 Tax=Streptomyces monashensis TaxID=1678012 RepID=UPI0015A5815B|nr:NAD(P)-dependent oxidoreductase [Streptomyces monashensis]
MAHAAFGTEILCCRRRPPRAGRPAVHGGPVPAELFAATDVVSVGFAHEPGVNGEGIGTEHLRAPGPAGHLVHVSRAALVDPSALRSALAEGAVAGASPDGCSSEAHPSPRRRPARPPRLRPDPPPQLPRTAPSTAPRP